MLFNSYAFIFLLLPIALLGNRVLAGIYRARIIWLLCCSLFFYGWWNPVYLPLLLGTITFNYLLGKRLRVNPTKAFLYFGVSSNLLLIGYFKYAGFFGENFEQISGIGADFAPIALPLAISFFTFQQIAYLADCYAGISTEYSPIEYALFVGFFPQLIAGPIVHHKELMPQIQSQRQSTSIDLSVGATIFWLGLFKKTVVADGIAPYANELFDNPQAWESVTFIYAWIGVLAYGLQIYFDFSGYSDMAIGAARMFGIKLPLNFCAPYRSETISDFWRRWHMTLSRFLRDYLYIPLGGNRHGTLTRYRNLILTMLLGGLWHGAGWTFVFWGLLHGIYLVVQHAWTYWTHSISSWKSALVYRLGACVLTFSAVHVAWTYFRASSLESANQIILGLTGQNGITIPTAIAGRLGFVTQRLSILGIQTDESSGAFLAFAILWIISLFAIVWLMPTTQKFMSKFEPAWEYSDPERLERDPGKGFGLMIPLSWQPNLIWSIVVSMLAVAGILTLPEISEFLYFQF